MPPSESGVVHLATQHPLDDEKGFLAFRRRLIGRRAQAWMTGV